MGLTDGARRPTVDTYEAVQAVALEGQVAALSAEVSEFRETRAQVYNSVAQQVAVLAHRVNMIWEAVCTANARPPAGESPADDLGFAELEQAISRLSDANPYAPGRTSLGFHIAGVDIDVIWNELIAEAPFGAQVLDTMGRYVRVNRAAARLAGFDEPDQMVGLHFSDLLPADELMKLQAHAANVALSHGYRNIDSVWEMKRPDGCRVHVRVSQRMIYQHDERLTLAWVMPADAGDSLDLR